MDRYPHFDQYSMGELCKSLRKYIFRHAKSKGIVNFYIVNALDQNLANSESCPILILFQRPKSVVQVFFQKIALFEQLNDQLLVNSK